MKKFLLALFVSLLSLSSAQAGDTVIFKCFGDSPKFPKLYIDLFEDEAGKLGSSYTMGSLPIYSPSWSKAGEVTTPPNVLLKLLGRVNQYRDTGIDPNSVKLFQNHFIDGSNTFSIELMKLMAADGTVLGWMALAYGEPVGCY